MKSKVFVFLLLFHFTGNAQYVHIIKADTLLVANDSCNAELILKNSTKNVSGFLFNSGNGKTEFRQAVVSLGNGQYLIGADTMRAVAGARPVQKLTDQSTISWNLSNGHLAEVLLKGNRTLSISSITNGSEGKIIIRQDSTGNRKLTLPSNSYNMDEGNGVLSLSPVAGAIDIASFIYDGSRYYWTLHKNYTAVPRTACFNFNMTPQYVAGWTDVSGNPHSAIRTATDFVTGIGVSSIATNKWVEYGGGSSGSLGENDANPVFVFPAQVTTTYWFNSVNTYSTSADCNIELNGLEVGARYNIEILASRESTDIAQPNRFMRAVCVDSTSTTIVEDFDAKRNTANLMMFANKHPIVAVRSCSTLGKGILMMQTILLDI